ncbi:hypothetical protein BMS3Abin15_00195 [bacterium BMS3Abin15]|nr:hypothetical protein BMS3Abin15_00195 [bacterium BMS3Abin15]HDZ85753.1 hypothetical protein [Candidatus Moranbacteria bacterium]
MINELIYTSRLGDIFLFVGNLLKRGLNKKIILEMTGDLCKGVEHMFNDSKIFPNGISEEKKTKMFSKMFSKNLHLVSSYRFWILNYGWLMMCSVFEDFLKDSIKEVLLKNPDLCKWDTMDEIIIEFSSRKTFKKRLYYFLKKLKISETEVFDLSVFKPEIQKKYEDAKIENIIEIFSKRHDIAHTDGVVIRSVKEFENAKELFDKLIINLSFHINKKWNVRTQMCDMRQGISEEK